jgi:hypothetical protein
MQQSKLSPSQISELATELAEQPRPPSLLRENYRSMFIARTDTDSAIVCRDDSVIECHRALLAVYSPQLKNVLQTRQTSPRALSPRTSAPAPRPSPATTSPRRRTSGNL